MAEFSVDQLSCRVKRTTKLYESVYDAQAGSVIIPAGTTFISSKQYSSNHSGFVHITDDSDYKGYWCPTAAVDTKIVQKPKNTESMTDQSGYTVEKAKLIIKSTRTSVYGGFSDTSAIPNGFRVGDEVTTDRKVTVLVNGTKMTRYRIASTTSEDKTVVGSWINYDQYVVTEQAPFDVAPSRKPKMRAALKATTNNTRAVTDPTSGSPSSEFYDTVYYTDSSGVQHRIYVEREPNITGDDPDNAAVAPNSDQVSAVVQESFATLTAMFLDADQDDLRYDRKNTLTGGPIGRMIFVHGMPFQYTYLTDRRNGTSNNFGRSDTDNRGDQITRNTVTSSGVDTYGRSFAKEIAYNIPIAVINPGKPQFFQPIKKGLLGSLPIFSNRNEGASLLASEFNATTELQQNAVAESMNALGGEFEYYTIQYDDLTYYQYVDSLSLATVTFLGIGEMYYHGTKLKKFLWSEYNSNAQQDFNTLEHTIGMDSGITFAYEPQGSVSNTIQNSTTESMLANTFNDFSSKAREMNFIAGYSGSGMDWINSNAEQAAAQIATGGGLIPDGFENAVSRVKSWALNSAKGMNVRFPEIWSDSNHAPSYEMECHFITPYATPFCIWRYVLMPFYHLFALAAPKSQKGNSQYSAPFLIKAYSKGYFSVEMGIIDSITWKRFGEGDMISEDGVPTQIDVTITFKDLYHSLAITSTGLGGVTNMLNFVNNTGLMEMVGTLSGINLTRMTLTKRLELFSSSILSAPGRLLDDGRHYITNGIRNTLAGLGINKITNNLGS